METHEPGADERQRETLARMSGQIADFFRTRPQNAAARQVADHINLFWSVSMRRDLRAMYCQSSPELHALVRQAWPYVRWPGG
jgi:formate dehydrogenase subunit delta